MPSRSKKGSRPSANTPRQPVVLPAKNWRDWLIGIGIGVVLLLFVIYGILAMSTGTVDRSAKGVVTAKHFTPAPPEQQITVGQGGLKTKEIDGDYELVVHVDGDPKEYHLPVDEKTYSSHNVGDKIVFLRPMR